MTDASQIKYLERANFLIEINRWREALRELRVYLSHFPNDYEALCQSALCHYEINELKSALRFSKKAISSEPELEWAYRLQSLIFRASGNNSKALEAAEICVQKAPFQIFSLQTLAYAQIDKFLLADAKETSEAMFNISPESAETHDVCGYLALKNEDWQVAEAQFKTALKINPESYFTLNNLGSVYFSQSKLGWSISKRAMFQRQAKECFERSVNINPTFKIAQENLQVIKEIGVIFNQPKRKIAFVLLRGILFLSLSFYAMQVY